MARNKRPKRCCADARRSVLSRGGSTLFFAPIVVLFVQKEKRGLCFGEKKTKKQSVTPIKEKKVEDVVQMGSFFVFVCWVALFSEVQVGEKALPVLRFS